MTFEAPELVRALLRESRSPRPPLPRPVPERPGPALPDGGRTLPLPEPREGGRPLEQVLARRESVRRFAAAPVPLPAVAAALAAADGGDRRDWAAERTAGVGLTLLLVAWNVEGLPAAAYRYDGAAHALVEIGPAPSAPAGSLLRQPEFATAGAVVEVAGDLAAAVARLGSHGHRLLLVRAGAAAHRAWLAALSADLAGCIFEGLLDAPLRESCAVDGWARARLVALALGRAATGAGGVR